MSVHLYYWDHVCLLRPALHFLDQTKRKTCIKSNSHIDEDCVKVSKLLYMYLLIYTYVNIFIICQYFAQSCSDFSVNLCIVPVPGHLAPVSTDSQPAGPWSGWLQHTHSSLDLDRRCPTGLFLVPAARNKHITTKKPQAPFLHGDWAIS